MQARIIFSCVLVTALMVNHAVFAETYAQHQHSVQPVISNITAGRVDAEALPAKVLNALNNDNRAEVLQRIAAHARQELRSQLDTTKLLNEIKGAVSALQISISNVDQLLSLTAR